MTEGTGRTRFILYGTSACHLCELAEEMLLAQRAAGMAFTYDKVDISETDQLFERYAVHIPVLRHPVAGELRWPFSPRQLRRFLAC